jgi:hypothetical protein
VLRAQLHMLAESIVGCKFPWLTYDDWKYDLKGR